MRIVVTTTLWFLAAWVSFDVAFFVLGWPRQATPLAATLVGLAVASSLTNGGRISTALKVRGRSSRADSREI
jgi:hypothetical protein